MTIPEIEDIFTRLCAGVIEHNQDLKLERTFNGSRMNKYVIRCNPTDFSRIIGKRGLRFKGMKFLMQAAGAKIGHSLSLETCQRPNVEIQENLPPFSVNVRWPKAEVTKLLQDTCAASFSKPVEIVTQEAVGSCIFIIKPDKLESCSLVDAIAPALQNIFSGIGTMCGCLISIDVD